MDSLFPQLPKDLAALADNEVNNLLAEHEQAAGLIDADDPEFLKDLSADEIIAQYRAGAEQITVLRAELKARADAADAYLDAKQEISETIKGEQPQDEVADEPAEEKAADAEAEAEAAVVADEPVTLPEATVTVIPTSDTTSSTSVSAVRMMRPLPTPAPDRVVVNEEPRKELALVASGLLPTTPPGTRFESRDDLAQAVIKLARALGKPTKTKEGREEKYPVAQLDYRDNFPPERTLDNDWAANSEKVRAIGSPYFGPVGLEALVASGGLCAPLTPIYTMPQLAVADRPVRDALPNFRAERGGINVPTPTTIGDADGSVTVITEANDALGGTFATKSCLTMDCPTYTETAVTIIAACREFGNLNAMAWPEKIAHENEITASFHARTAEGYLLDQIKALSVNVTSGASTLGALIYLVDAIARSAFGIRSRLRLPREARFQVLLPAVTLDFLLLDTVQNQFDRYRTRGDFDAYLRSTGIDPTYYLDTAATGDSQIADASQGAGALDGFPASLQWALFPAGTFLHIDMAELNLGIVRDSTLNSTNDFQYFYETFENVARIGPAQAAYWETTEICPQGTFPDAGTAITCGLS